MRYYARGTIQACYVVILVNLLFYLFTFLLHFLQIAFHPSASRNLLTKTCREP